MLVAVVACARGEHQGPGEVTRARVPPPVVAARAPEEARAATALAPGTPPAKQILFGDLHVHTTFSADAFIASLPMLQGEGVHPPADACDFARFCSSLDFWSINDHAEAISPQHWQETKEAIRQCNAVAGEPHDPATGPFPGGGGSRGGTAAPAPYGPKNAHLHDTPNERRPHRPH